MGSWSADMLGGDRQLDTLGFLGDICGLPCYPVPERPRDIHALCRAFESLAEAQLDPLMSYDELPVVAVVYMAVGARIPAIVSQFAIQGAQQELAQVDDLGWHDGGVERRQVLTQFITDLEGYRPGTPVPVGHRGLLQVMSENSSSPHP